MVGTAGVSVLAAKRGARNGLGPTSVASIVTFQSRTTSAQGPT